jgi:NAD(P)-dependent dehydrogenase (short-subunit alcohol dehydrogenase family)
MAIPDLTDVPIEQLMSLAGRVAVVTGGGAGIGRGVAQRLAEAGASALILDRDGPKGKETARLLAERYGVPTLSLAVDISDPEAVEAAAETAVAELGGLDIWVNVAGIYPIAPEEFLAAPDMTEAAWNRMLAVNLSGTFWGARAAARRMIAAGKPGVIINMQSAMTQAPLPGFAHYASTKGAIEILTKSLAVELGGHGIRVLSISPTIVATPGMLKQKPVLAEAFGNVGDPHEIYGAQLPLGRIANPDDIGRVALFLASDLSLIMTGSVVAADAGDLTARANAPYQAAVDA